MKICYEGKIMRVKQSNIHIGERFMTSFSLETITVLVFSNFLRELLKLHTLVSPEWYLSDAQQQTGCRSTAIAPFLLPPSNSHQIQIVSEKESWRSFEKSWWRVGRINYLENNEIAFTFSKIAKAIFNFVFAFFYGCRSERRVAALLQPKTNYQSTS